MRLRGCFTLQQNRVPAVQRGALNLPHLLLFFLFLYLFTDYCPVVYACLIL